MTAQRVANDPDRWLDVLAERSHKRVLPPMWSHVGDEEMVADLPVNSWLGLLDREDINDLPSTDNLISYDDVPAFALRRMLTLAAHPDVPAALLRHFAWPLLLRPGIDRVVRAELAVPDHAAAWRALAAVTPDLVARRCSAYADLGARPAA